MQITFVVYKQIEQKRSIKNCMRHKLVFALQVTYSSQYD